MRIVGLSDIDAFCSRHRSAAPDLRALLAIMECADWHNTNDVKRQFGEIATDAAPGHVRLALAGHGVSVDLNVNFHVGLVRLSLVDLKKR